MSSSPPFSSSPIDHHHDPLSQNTINSDSNENEDPNTKHNIEPTKDFPLNINPKYLSYSSGVFSLTKCIVGASSVGLPYAFSQLGPLLGSLLVLFVGTMNYYSLLSVMLCGRKLNKNSLSDLGFYLHKEKGKFVVNILLFFTCIVPLVMYIKQTSEYYHDVFRYIFGTEDINKNVIVILTISLNLFMCLLFRKVDKLKNVSLFGLGFLLLLGIYIVFMFILNIKNIKFSEIQYFKIDSGSLGEFSNICFSFCSVFSVLSITGNIETKTTSKNVILSSNAISALFFIICGFMGSLYNINCTKKFIDGTKEGESIIIANILKMALGTVNVLTYPLIMLATRSAFHSFCCNYIPKNIKKKEAFVDNIETGFIVLLCYGLSFMAMRCETFLGNMFFLVGSLVMFAMPSYFYYRIFGRNGGFKFMVVLLINCALTVFGLSMGVIGFYKAMFGKTG